MAKSILTILLFVSFSSIGSSQMKAPANVGIDEKLGKQVAMDVVLKDENGNDLTLSQLIDKPTVLIFNYYRCPGICPVLLNSIVGVVNQIQLEPGKDFRLISISFDPADTPEQAKQKKANYLNMLKRQFSPDAWYFLTGAAENSKAVADSAGFNYRREGDMYVHPGAIIVLTPKGIISRYLYGTTFLTADVAMAIQEAAGGKVRPTISKVLSFCYAYDPAARTYVFSITRFVGAVILILAGIFLIFTLKGRKKT
ncbi:MAG TPA: SCO family protein [Acidobacteriota bacterium]|nr:SCO family protein [Acidobacteriota bacterium]